MVWKHYEHILWYTRIHGTGSMCAFFFRFAPATIRTLVLTNIHLDSPRQKIRPRSRLVGIRRFDLSDAPSTISLPRGRRRRDLRRHSGRRTLISHPYASGLGIDPSEALDSRTRTSTGFRPDRRTRDHESCFLPKYQLG